MYWKWLSWPSRPGVSLPQMQELYLIGSLYEFGKPEKLQLAFKMVLFNSFSLFFQLQPLPWGKESKENLLAVAETRNQKARRYKGYFLKTALGIINKTAQLLLYWAYEIFSEQSSLSLIISVPIHFDMYVFSCLCINQAASLISLVAGVLGNVFLLKNMAWKMFCCNVSPGVAITAPQFPEQGLTSGEGCERRTSIFSGRRRRVPHQIPLKIPLAKDTVSQSG